MEGEANFLWLRDDSIVPETLVVIYAVARRMDFTPGQTSGSSCRTREGGPTVFLFVYVSGLALIQVVL